MQSAIGARDGHTRPSCTPRGAAYARCGAAPRRDSRARGGRGAAAGARRCRPRGSPAAIAAESLRWLVDLDALIDGATHQRLPDDAKPRAVLRLMLAQWLRLEVPPHAVIATALPLLAGGPRRLAHGVFSALAKQGAALPTSPSLPPEVAARWGERAGVIAAGLAEPPPLDLTLRDADQTAHWAERLGGISLAPGHIRLARGTAVERLDGFAEGAWWVQDLAASLAVRLLGRRGGAPRARPVCCARRQDAPACRRRLAGDRGRRQRPAARTAAGQPLADGPQR